MKNIWNSVAGVYDWFFATALNRDLPLLMKLGQFKASDRILDYGGGTGRVAQKLKEVVREVVVADPAVKMLAEAEKKGLKTFLITNVPTALEADSFDIVIAVDTLHHFKEQEVGLREIYRVLKLGGTFIIEEPHPDTWIRLALWTEKIFEKVNFFRPQELQALLEKIGFSITEYEFSAPSYFFKAKK